MTTTKKNSIALAAENASTKTGAVANKKSTKKVVRTAAKKRRGANKKAAAKITVTTEELAAAATPVVQTVKKKRKRTAKTKKTGRTNSKTPVVVLAEEKTTTTTDTTTAATETPSTVNNKDTSFTAIPPPQMWASHTTHQFATKQLESTYKFVRERLVHLMTTIYNETDPTTINNNVIAVLGKKPIKIKKLKDPNAPKKPKNGYMLFCQDFVNSNKVNTTNLVELSREQSRCWKELEEIKKQEYLDIAERQKVLYEEELKKYNEKGSIVTQIVV